MQHVERKKSIWTDRKSSPLSSRFFVFVIIGWTTGMTRKIWRKRFCCMFWQAWGSTRLPPWRPGCGALPTTAMHVLLMGAAVTRRFFPGRKCLRWCQKLWITVGLMKKRWKRNMTRYSVVSIRFPPGTGIFLWSIIWSG